MSTRDPLQAVETPPKRSITAGVDDSVTLTVTDRDVAYLQSLDEAGKLTLESVDERRDEDAQSVVVSSTDYAGVVGLPDTESLYIEPKISHTALLRLLQLDETDGGVETVDQAAEIESGTEFVDLLAALFTDELSAVMRQGISRSYQRVQSTEDYLRGRLEVHQQLQQAGPAATTFHCSHDELTRDTQLNRAILHATRILVRLTEDGQIQRQLHRQMQQLRRDISLETVPVREVRRIDLSRLTSHYADLLRLAELVISNTLIEDLQSGDAMAYTLLLDMPQQYQDALVSPLRDLYPEYDVAVEDPLTDFLEGDFDLKPEPDYVLKQASDPVLVLDAKWKDLSGKPKTEDIYQLIAYQQYFDVPGVLLYPNTSVESPPQSILSVDIKHGHELFVGQLPVTDAMDSFAAYRSEMLHVLRNIVDTAVVQ